MRARVTNRELQPRPVRPILTVLLAALLAAACGPSGSEGGASDGDDASAEEARGRGVYPDDDKENQR